MAKHHWNPKLRVGLAATFIAFGLATWTARADVVCRRAGIAGSDGRELFVAATARAKEIIGSGTTSDPARLKAVITVNEGMLFVYSNFVTPGADFPTKIATNTPYDLGTLALNLVGGDDAARETRRAFGDMTFYVDQRVLDHSRFARLSFAGARNVWIVDRNGGHRRWTEPVARPAVPRSSKWWPRPGQAIVTTPLLQPDGSISLSATNDVRLPLSSSLEETSLNPDQRQLLRTPWVIPVGAVEPAYLKMLIQAVKRLQKPFAITTQRDPLARYAHRRDWQQFNVLTHRNSLRKVTKHGEIVLSLVNGLSAGSPGGKTLKFLVWHQGKDGAEVFADWLKRARDGEFRGQHIGVIGCPLSLSQFIELQNAAIANGALSCTIPTEEVNLPAAALAAVTLSNHPELLDGATPLEALRRGYRAAAAPLAEALAITDDGLAIERLKVAFGERGVDFFRRGNGSFDRATARAILEGLRGDPAQFIECVDARRSPDASVQPA